MVDTYLFNFKLSIFLFILLAAIGLGAGVYIYFHRKQEKLIPKEKYASAYVVPRPPKRISLRQLLPFLPLVSFVFLFITILFLDTIETIVPPRSIVGKENIDLIWSKDIKIKTGTDGYVEFFKPDERSVVFWNSNFLNSVDILTGEILWKTEAVDASTIRMSDNKFFVISYDWSPFYKELYFDTKPSECSSDYGSIVLLAYNAITGEKIWGYRYDGADTSYLSFDDTNVYLEGSANHATSQSIVQIDKNTGNNVSINCNEWPNKNIIPTPPRNEGGVSSTYIPIVNEQQTKRKNRDYPFIVEGSKLIALNGSTKNPIAFIEFSGEALNPERISIVNQKNVIMVYLQDSRQLFSFRLLL
jgi:hypothetical protein